MIDLTGIQPGDVLVNALGEEAVYMWTWPYDLHRHEVLSSGWRKSWYSDRFTAGADHSRIVRWEPRADVVELRAENARLAAEVARYREVIGQQLGIVTEHYQIHYKAGYGCTKDVYLVSAGKSISPLMSSSTMLVAFDAAEAIRKSEGDANG